MSNVRCIKCQKLLAVQSQNNTFEIKCTRCGTLNSVLEKMTEQVIITNQNGTILFVNEAVAHMTGYSVSESIGQTPALWGGQMSHGFYEKMWETIRTNKEAIVTQVTNKHKSGSLYRAKLCISPVLDSHGEVAFFVGIESVIPPEKT